jgi:hypothetical protein
MKRWQLLGVYALVVLATAVGFYNVDQRAEHVKSEAQRTRVVVEKFVSSERICTDSNESACRALFERLSRNITTDQRLRLACLVVSLLSAESKTVVQLAKTCPRAP